MLLGLAAAFALAALSVLRPAIAAALMPPSLVLQTMPLVALTPIVVLIFGRDLAAILAVTVSVVFFSRLRDPRPRARAGPAQRDDVCAPMASDR